MIWIAATVAAAALQVARNGLQRSLMAGAGPWGATLVRFLFGLPFSLILAVVACLLTPGARPSFSIGFWGVAAAGALAQVLATAALLVAMRRGGFAVATALQQSSLPLAAILGLFVFGDRLSATAWIGVAATSAGLAALSWPRRGAAGERPATGAVFGLASGLAFGFSLNAFRRAGLELEPAHRVYAAIVSLCVVQAMQAAGLGLYLAARDRAALRAVAAGWRASVGAGFFGAAASACWFIAVALSPAGPVRAVGVIEAPIAALAGRRFFKETLRPAQILAGLAVLAGVVMTSLW
ncbi:MAG: DMT family transporter [Caulobacteraceae bacterium]|nr:DMT family transporter [Caulobacteraceae bacterium]